MCVCVFTEWDTKENICIFQGKVCQLLFKILSTGLSDYI